MNKDVKKIEIDDGLEYLKRCPFRVPEDAHTSKTAHSGIISDFEIQLVEFMSKGYFRRNGGRLMMYDGLRYVEMTKVKLNTLIMNVLKFHGYSSVYRTKVVREIHDYVYAQDYIPEFKPERRYVCFKNGVYDIDLEQMVKDADQSIEAYIYIDHIFKENSRGYEFEKFINHVLPVKEDRMVLQEALGCMFIDRSQMKIENCFYLYGTGANGKSVISDLLKFMLGSELMSSYSMQELLVDNDKLRSRAEIAGKLINFCSDMGTKDFSGGDYKKMVSGEEMNCRKINCDPFTTTLIPLFFASVNEFPNTSDYTHGSFRRNIVIPFSVTIHEKDQDKSLGAKLRGEVSYFISWILKGYKRIKKQELLFTESKNVIEMINRMKTDSNPVLSFLDIKGYYKDDMKDGNEYEFNWLLCGNVHNDYVNWYIWEYGVGANGVSKHVKKHKFRTMLMNEGFTCKEDSHTKQWDVKIYTKTGNKKSIDITEENIFDSDQYVIDNLPF